MSAWPSPKQHYKQWYCFLMEEISGFPVEIHSSIYNMNQWNSFPKMKDYLYQIYQIGVMLFVSVNSVDSFCVCAGFVRWGWESSVMNCRMDYQNGSCGSSNLKQLGQKVSRKKVLMWCSEVFILHIQQILPPKINIEPESIFETGSNRF